MKTPASTLRSYLRDTALTVSMLQQGSTVEDIRDWREHCIKLVQTLRTKLEQAGYATEIIDQVSYAQCALLDENALRYLPEAQRGEWELEPLQVHFFSSYNAGEVLCDRMRALRQSANPSAELAECYATVLGLGFTGHYDERNEGERQRLKEDMLRLSHSPLPENFDGRVWIERGSSGWGRYRFWVSPLLWAALGLILTVIVYIALSGWLNQAVIDLGMKH